MTEEKNIENENIDAENQQQDEKEESGKEKKAKQLKKELSETEKKLAQTEEKLDETKTKYIAVCAEYENFRKRSAKEKEELYSGAVASVVTSFLPLLDNIERALSYSPDDEGLKALRKQLDEIFASLGVTEMQTDGAQFDPNLHNAIMHEENPELGENVITQTFAKGYAIGDKVLRHAMVKVAN